MESTPPHTFLKLILFLFILHYFPELSPPISSTSPLPKEALPTKSGYLRLNSTTGSAIFYTFYEAQKPISPLSETPLLIWLQGGPGCSSLLGNFYELGPWRVSSHKQNVQHLSLEPNPGSWNRLFGLIFIDNPIGVGFSIASTPQEIPKDQHTVGKHLFKAIKAFIALDPLFKSRPIYVTGESYAGKYVPAIGYYILKRNAQSPVSSRVNLAGVAIGNGLTDPATQVGGDGLLNVTEFNNFLHPADSDSIKLLQWLCNEEIRERDTDKDGKLNFKEFFHGLFDLVRNYEEESHNSTHESNDSLDAPARKLFADLDKDADGYLSGAELLPIIGKLHPSEHYYAKQQADYVIQQADANKDGHLTLSEMIDSPYVFYSAIFNEDEDDDYEYHDEFR